MRFKAFHAFVNHTVRVNDQEMHLLQWFGAPFLGLDMHVLQWFGAPFLELEGRR